MKNKAKNNNLFTAASEICSLDPLLHPFAISSHRHDLRDRSSRRAKFYRRLVRIAEDLATERADLFHILSHILHFDREMVNAWPPTRNLSHCGIFAIVAQQREIDFSVAE